MILTVRVIKMSITSHNYQSLIVSTLQINSFKQLSRTQHSVVEGGELIHLITGSWCLLATFPHFLQLPAPSDPKPTQIPKLLDIYFYRVSVFRFHMQVRS